MSDIVERLRASSEHSQRCGWLTHARLDWQAADEIEQLRHDIEQLVAASADLATENERSSSKPRLPPHLRDERTHA